MRPPDRDEQEDFYSVAKRHPRFMQFLQEWYEKELNALPSAETNVAKSQGRCQFAGELLRHLTPVPDRTAKPAKAIAKPPEHNNAYQ